MLLISLCGHSGPLYVFYIIKIAFKIICILLPLIIIYRAIASMFKIVMSGKDIQKELLCLTKSLTAAFIIFLLPSFFQFLFVNLLNANDVDIISCFEKATLENIKVLKEEEKNNALDELELINKEKADELNKQKEQEEKQREEQKRLNEEKKRKEEEEEAARRQQEAEQNGASGSSGGANFKNASKNIIVGDSRTVGMCIAITGDSRGCSYSSGGAKQADTDIFIAQSSSSYSWFNSTAVGAVNSILSSNPNTTYNIYSLMGANMLLYDINKYIPLYNSLASGAWSKHNVILVSVNPVDEVVEAQHGYSTKNADIITFNTKLRNGVTGGNVKYCDTYNSILNNLSTTDGLHYTSATYQSIYSKIKACGS